MKFIKNSKLWLGFILALIAGIGMSVGLYYYPEGNESENKWCSGWEDLTLGKPYLTLVAERAEYTLPMSISLSDVTNSSPIRIRDYFGFCVSLWRGDKADSQIYMKGAEKEESLEIPPNLYTLQTTLDGVCRDVVFRYNGEDGQVVARGVDWYVMIKR